MATNSLKPPKSPRRINPTSSNNDGNSDSKDTNRKSHGRSRSFDYIMNKKSFSPKPIQQPPPSPHLQVTDLKQPVFSASGNLEATIETPRTPRGGSTAVGTGNSVFAGTASAMGDLNSIASLGNHSILDCPTELHKAVASKTTTISQLRAHLLARPSAAFTKDAAGRLPLHLISGNKELFSYHLQSQGGDKLASFIMDLFEAYPMAIIQADSEGRLPFTYAIHEWIDKAHDRDAFLTNPSSVGADFITTNLDNKTESIMTTSTLTGKKMPYFQRHKFSAIPTSSSKAKDHTNNSKQGKSKHLSHENDSKGLSTGRRANDNGNINNNRVPALGRLPYWQNREAGSIATATISNMDASGSFEMNSAAGWSMDDTIPENVRLDKAAHWDFKILTQFLDKLNFDGKSGRKINAYSTENIDIIAEASAALFIMDRTHSFSKDQGSISSRDTGGRGAGGIMVSPPKMLRIESHENDLEDIGNDPSWLASILVSGVASIPSILKIILAISADDPDRSKLMSYSITKAILDSHYSVGNWLVHMLEHPKQSISSAAVDYLELISSRSVSSIDSDATREREQLFTKVGNLDYFLISLLGLKHDKDVKRGASTKVVQNILNWILASSSVLVVAICDLLFHFVLIVTFQHFTNLFLRGDGRKMEGLATYYLTMISILYLLIRKLSHFSVMLKMSWNSFLRYSFRFLDVLDVSTLVVALGCILMIEMRLENGDEAEYWFRELLSISTAMIWAKFIGFMYIVNLDVKFFICAIWQNFKNIKWLLMFLAVCIFLFAQMMHVIVSSPTICTQDAISPYCESNFFIQGYSIVLGMFDADEFTPTLLATLLFVLFSFVTVLILLSAIFAVTVKTFASLSNRRPFGDTRLTYFAEVKAFHRLLVGQWSLVQYCSMVLFVCSIAVLILLSVASMRSILLKYHNDGIVIGGAVILLIFVWVSILSFLSHISFYDFMEIPERRTDHPDVSRKIPTKIKKIIHFLSAPARFTIRELLHSSNLEDDDYSAMFQQSKIPHASESRNLDLQIILTELNRIEKEMKDAQTKTKVDVMAQIRSIKDTGSYMDAAKKSDLASF